MKTKILYIITTVFLFMATSPMMAQRGASKNTNPMLSQRGASKISATNPKDVNADPDLAPIDDYLWVLVLVGVVFAIIKLKAYAKQTKPSLK